MVLVKSLYILIFLFIIVAFSACGGENGNRHVSLLGADTTKVNPNSMAYLSVDKNEDRKNKLELSKIEADAKIEIAKIQSNSQVHIAKVNAQTQQEIAKSDSVTKIKTSQLDASTKKETMQYTVYIVIAVVFFFIVALILLYLNSKKNRELKKALQEAQFIHERDLREKEFEERRIHKILDLVSEGKLPASVKKEVILSLSSPKTKVIENIEV